MLRVPIHCSTYRSWLPSSAFLETCRYSTMCSVKRGTRHLASIVCTFRWPAPPMSGAMRKALLSNISAAKVISNATSAACERKPETLVPGSSAHLHMGSMKFDVQKLCGAKLPTPLRQLPRSQRFALSLSAPARDRNVCVVWPSRLFSHSAIASSSRRFCSQACTISVSPSALAAAMRIV